MPAQNKDLMSKVSFDNTEIAFQSKSNVELLKAYRLFKLVGNATLVRLGKIAVNLALKLHLPIKPFVKKTIFEQFCGGEYISDCNETIIDLSNYNIGSILDYSVEGKEDDEGFEQTTKEIIGTIYRAGQDTNIPFSVFKMTGIAPTSVLEKANQGIEHLNGKDLDEYDKIRQRVTAICQAAFDTGVPVFIDAEESWIQNTIDLITEEMMASYNKENVIVFTTLQFYRWDRLDYLKTLHEKAKEEDFLIGVKLVRGAYMEKERERATEKGYKSPIQATRENTNEDFDFALKYCIENIDKISICAGSHNEKSVLYLCDLMTEKGIDKADKRVWFAQLYGMSDHISYNLANAGYNVAKYVPYGPVKEVLPYLIRRAEENTSVAGQTSRELSLITKELERRKALKK